MTTTAQLELPPDSLASLDEVLRWRAATAPNQIAYIFDDDGSTLELTYAELDAQARAIAAWLQERAAPADRVLLACSQGLGYVRAFFGSLYAGTIAVPSAPPEAARAHRTLARLRATLGDAAPAIVLSDRATLAASERLRAQQPDIAAPGWHALDAALAARAGAWRAPERQRDDL